MTGQIQVLQALFNCQQGPGYTDHGPIKEESNTGTTTHLA